MALLRVNEVASILGISKSYSYKLIAELNEELSQKGYYTLKGKIEERYLLERFRLEDRPEWQNEN